MNAAGGTRHADVDLQQLQTQGARLNSGPCCIFQTSPQHNEHDMGTGAQMQSQGVGIEQIA